MRALSWIGLFLVVGIVSLKFAPEKSQETVATCARDFSDGVRSSVPPDFDRYIPLAKLRAASRVLCSEWMAYERHHATRGVESLAAVVREKPRLYLPLCNVMVDADFAGNAKAYRFVTKAERNRYRRGHCSRAVDYFLPKTIAIDRRRIAADHPALYAPFCASLIQSEAGTTALASFSRRELQAITRRSCVEALKSGVIECGPGGFVDANVDQAGFDAILDRQGL